MHALASGRPFLLQPAVLLNRNSMPMTATNRTLVNPCSLHSSCARTDDDRFNAAPKRLGRHSLSAQSTRALHAVPVTAGSDGRQALPDSDQTVGWHVIDVQSKNEVGIVREVMHPERKAAAGYPVLRVCRSMPQEFAVDLGEEVHFVPYVEPIIQHVDITGRRIIINPPEGLLDLAHQQRLLTYLRPILQAMAQSHARKKDQMMQYMPSKRELASGGHADLIPLIESAGGFLAVAQALSLRARRRPAGFWENLDVLDEEISKFVAAAWTELPIAEGEGTYFYNQVTGVVRWDSPLAEDGSGTASSTARQETEDDHIMPSQSTVQASGRWDLHHAIVYNGGYNIVAEELGRAKPPRGRRPSSPPESVDPKILAEELREFAETEGLPPDVVPPQRHLREAGRLDLLQDIRELGGYNAAAQVTGLQTSRRPRHHWHDFDTVVGALRQYVEQRPDLQGKNRLPTHKELISEGRHELRYAMTQHSHTELAAALGVRPSRRGGHRKPQFFGTLQLSDGEE